MPELTDTFSNLRAIYSNVWAMTVHAGPNRAALLETFAAPHWYGVYIIYRHQQQEPIYVGSAGKLERSPVGAVRKGQFVKYRLSGANTPYFLDPDVAVLRYGPTTTGAGPAGYNSSVQMADIYIESFHIPATQAATPLEHLLLQGCVREFGNLPEANQKF